jgi:signal transduction histidine kinase/DNA-binding response OmpR family regulator
MADKNKRSKISENSENSETAEKSTLSHQFNRFSLILYLVISVVCITAFVLSSYNVGTANIERNVSFAAESANLSLAETMNSELGYIIKLSNSYTVQDYFNDPADEIKRARAFEEFDYYRTSFLSEKDVFWINDIERVFYSSYSDPYSVDPELPENYWYNLTLYDTEYYNFNVNYNPDLGRTKLWINAPVFQKTTFGESTIPTGMLGAGVDLTEFSAMLYSALDENVDVYIFNRAGEITVAENTDIVAEKIKIYDLFDGAGARIFDTAELFDVNTEDSVNFEIDGRFYSLNYITSMDWFVCASSSFNTANIFDNSTTIIFVMMYLTLLIVYLMMFFFVRHVSKILTLRQEELINSKTDAEAASKAKSDFLALMSHEIRTPLNAIIGVAQILLNDDIRDKYRNSVEEIKNSGKSLLAIINDILDLTKIETGKLEITPAEYDVPSLINDTVQLNTPRIGSKPIEFTLTIEKDIPEKLFGDELRIKQILNNILTNAFKYTDSGSVKMRVSFEEYFIGSDLIISVSDTGQGMKPENVAILGNEFSRFNLDANRTTEGTGLGMNITKRLLALMNGTMEIESEFGKGSTFTVTIPQEARTKKTIGEDTAKRLSDFTFTRDKQTDKKLVVREAMPYGKVLVVDDVETNLYVAEGLLRPYGIAVTTVSSGYEAIDLIQSGETFDIIFMDHMMPKMDGIETAGKLRNMGYKAPIAALTANALTGNDAMFIEKGFDDFLSKPIDVHRLNAVLNRFVRDTEKAVIAEPITSVEEAISPKLLDVFIRDAEKSIPVLETLGKDDLKLFTTTAHAMKSACANVKNTELSELAKALEAAGREGDMSFIEKNTPDFIQKLSVFIDSIKPLKNSGLLSADPELLSKTLSEIAAACENYDSDSAEQLLSSLAGFNWDDETSNVLSEISKLLLHAEFEEAAAVARKNIL